MRDNFKTTDDQNYGVLMLIVLSDLHFSETKSSQIGPHRFSRNLRPENYLAYFAEVNKLALANDIKKSIWF
jgi:hypothetical protein